MRTIAVSFLTLLTATLVVAQSTDVTKLDRVTVLAGQFPTGEQPGAVLNSLDVVRTPGSAADINRALQTLPGVQLVDEGNALFVRGGDSAETTTLINGVRYPTALRLNAPLGNFTGTVNPFEARRITFSSGGFGARFGNTLSGVVDVETVGAPGVYGANVGVGLGAVSLGLDAAFTDNAGLRIMATRSSVAPINRVNGSNHDYPVPPNGHDLALAGSWEYRPGGELRIFSVEQVTRLGVNVRLPTQHGVFSQAITNRLGTANWADTFGRWTAHIDLGAGTLDRTETVGVFAFSTSTRHYDVAARLGYDFGGTQVSAGVERNGEEAKLEKQFVPAAMVPFGSFHATVRGVRDAGFIEADTMLLPHVRAIVGLRTDNASLTHRRTVDPRISLAWEPRRNVTFSVAGGVYHQVPAAYDFIGPVGRVVLPAMRVNEVIGAVQFGKNDRLARFEVYTKEYSHLVALDRNYLPVAGGVGRAEGFDVFLRSSLPWAMNGRATYSFGNSRRTDPDSGQVAAAPFDVTHTASVIVERAFGGWVTGLAARYASGRPFTPIIDGVPAATGGFSPVYGAPSSERYPSLLRFDLSTSRYYRLNRHTGLVLYAAITNVLGRENVYSYEYSDDFKSRRPTPSLFKRGLYCGFSVQFN